MKPTDTTKSHAGAHHIITRHLVPEANRMAFVDKLFGISYVLKLEPTVFRFAEQLATNYDYGYWEFWSLSNTGFYLAPRSNTLFEVSCENGFEGRLSQHTISDITGVSRDTIRKYTNEQSSAAKKPRKGNLTHESN